MTDIAAVLRAVAPRANPAFVAASVPVLGGIMAQNGFSTVNAQAMLIAQTGHECQFRTFEENLKYSAARLVQVWPRRFRSIADAQPFANNPKALANNVYGGRMGNRPGTDDGWDNRGSGALQHTGEDERKRVQKRTGAPSLAVLRDPKNAEAMWKAAATFFVDRKALEPALAGDVPGTTRKVNGGLIGIHDRQLLFSRAVAKLEGAPIPKGKTTIEQSDDARRRAGQATAAAPVGGGTGAGGSRQGGVDNATAIAVGIGIAVACIIAAILLYRHHRAKRDEVEEMQLQAIAARIEAASA